ncbi:hypothetical protein [Streptomyces sp. NPDC055056]
MAQHIVRFKVINADAFLDPDTEYRFLRPRGPGRIRRAHASTAA